MAYYTGPDFRTGIPGLINNQPIEVPIEDIEENQFDNQVLSPEEIMAAEAAKNADMQTQNTGGKGDVLGQFPGIQGQNDPLNPANKQRYSYESYNGKTFKVDNETGEVEEFNGFLGTAGILGSIIGNFRNIRNAAPNVQAAYSNALSRDQRNVDLDKRDPTNAGTYGIGETEEGLQVREDSFYERLKNLGRDDLTGEGTEETTEAATIAAYNRQKEIAEATKIATEQRLAQQINEKIRKQNAVGGMSVDDFEDALNRMTDKQFKSFNRTNEERGITTARTDP